MIGAFGFLSEYNLLRSTYKLKDLLDDTKKHNYPFIAINDTNNLYGSYKLFKYAEIPYIIGMKLEIIHLGMDCSLLLYAINDKGFQNLTIISSMMQLSERPRLEFTDILNFQEGLYFISAGHESDIDKSLINKNIKEAERRVVDYQEKLTTFSLGLSLQNFTQEVVVAPKIKDFAKRYKLLMLPVNYVAHKKEDKEIYEMIRQVQNSEESVDNIDYSFQTLAELKKRYLDYPEVFENLKVVFPSFVYKYKKPKFNLPKIKGIKDSKKELAKLTNEGLEKYFKVEVIKNKSLYHARLKKELDVIDELGYNDYFLIVWDFVKYAKSKDILVGPGRGSAAGSLVSFTLRITDVDPLKYGLLFERFLNKERKTMPDIDLDFPDDRREEVIEYIKNKYGTNRVLSINTFSRFSAKSAIRDICRIKDYTPTQTNQIVKVLTEQKDNLSPELKEIKRLAEGFGGLPRQTGTHAAGIILAKEDLRYYLPLQKGPMIYQTQYEHEDLEDMGLLKIDLLGIRNLSIIKRVVELIQEKRNVKIDIGSIPLDDKKTYELLSEGDTLGIFQLESNGMINTLRKLKPKTFNDIVAILALYRPGPMKNIDTYINRKNGEKFNYFDKSLEPILKETYGIIVYQEQIILIAEEFAGYSLSEADMLRVGVSKKDKAILQQEREKFVRRSILNKRSETLAERIYDYIVEFADYGFNKSHSVAYGLVAYQMAYLKANYYDIFMAVLLSKMINDEKLFYIIDYLRKKGINVLAPNINLSTDEYLVTDVGLIYPLTGVKGLGNQTIKKILEERDANGQFQDYGDLKRRLSGILTDKMLENLIFSGSLSPFGKTKKELYENINFSTSLYDDLIGDLVLKEQKEYDLSYLAEKEKEALGFNLEISPLEDITNYEKKYKLTSIKDLTFAKKNQTIVGLVRRVNEITTKKGDKMAFVTMTDYLSNVDLTVFPEEYNKYQELFSENNKIVVSMISQNYKGGSWILKKAKKME